MSKKQKQEKAKCHHPKKPDYTPEEQEAVNFLNSRIDSGDPSAYADLTKLAVTIVNEGRFYRETCENCHGISTSESNQG